MTGGSDYHGDTGHRAAALGAVNLPAVDFAALRAPPTLLSQVVLQITRLRKQ